jgi:hypothetical protein
MKTRPMSCSGLDLVLRRVDNTTAKCSALCVQAVAAVRSIQFRAKRNELFVCSSTDILDKLSNAQNDTTSTTTFTITVSFDTGDDPSTNATCQPTIEWSIGAGSYINCALHLLPERSSKPSSIPCRRTTPVPLHQEAKVPPMQAPLSSSTNTSILLTQNSCLCSTILPAVSPTTALSDHYRTVASHHSRIALVISCIRSPPSSRRVLHVHQHSWSRG